MSNPTKTEKPSRMHRSEKEMREQAAPWPKSIWRLAWFIWRQIRGRHDCGTCVYAVSLSAVATINYVAVKLGMTGYQVSCADLDIIRRSRSIDGPFIILKAEDAIYPQYDLPKRLAETMREWEPWMSEKAREKIAEVGDDAAPHVVAHWQRLAASHGTTPAEEQP